MKRIGDLFEKYRLHIKAPQKSVERESILVVKKITNFDLTEEQVIYTPATRTLYIKAPSILKSELQLHYPVILKELALKLGKVNSPNTIL